MQANTEAETAQAKAEKAVAEAKAAQARANNLAAANARHAARTVREKERIVAKYELAHPTNAMPVKFTKPEEVIDFFARMDKNKDLLRIDTIAQNGDFYFGSILSSANGSTNIRGEINLSAKARDNIVSAMNKIKNKQSDTITLEESKWMSTLWHELTHNKHKNLDTSDFICGRTIGQFKKTSDYKIQCMELLNEYVARQTLPEFYDLLKIEMKFPELMKVRDNTGYDYFMQRFDYTLDYFNIDRAAALKQIKQGLFYDEYIFNQDKVLETFFAANIKGIKPKQVKQLVQTILGFSPFSPSLDRFKIKLLDPLRNEIETANSKKKKSKK